MANPNPTFKTTISPTEISTVNVEELIRSHCEPKIKHLNTEILSLAKRLAELIQEQSRLQAHAILQAAFDIEEGV